MVTKDLGDYVRNFASDTCSNFATKELPRKADARLRWQAQQNGDKSKRTQATALRAQTRQLKSLNLQTYKFHTLADYPLQIRMYGTTDSYSTQSVSALPQWYYL